MDRTIFPLRIAQKFNISLIFYGENSEVEYGGNMNDAYVPTRQWKNKNVPILMSGVSPEEFTNYGIESKDLYWYTPPTQTDLDALNLEIHYMSY